MPWHDRARAWSGRSVRPAARSVDCDRRRRTGSERSALEEESKRRVASALFALCGRVIAVAACTGGGASGEPAVRRRVGRRAPDARPAPAPVVPAGPVRRLLRGQGPGLLRRRGLRRHDPAGRGRDRAGHGRRRAARPSSASAGCRGCSPRASRGADPVVIAQVFQRSPTLQVSFKDKNITKPEDLKGKKVGSWGFGNEAELYAGLRKAGLDPDNPDDVTIVAQQFDMVAFAAGEIDAAQAMIYNEYAQVLETKNPAPASCTSPRTSTSSRGRSTGPRCSRTRSSRPRRGSTRPATRTIAGQVPQGLVQGLDLLPRQPRECVDIVLKSDAGCPRATRPGSSTRSTGSSGRPERDRHHR